MDLQQERQRSLSQNIDICITILKEFILQCKCELENIEVYMINNTSPLELRSFIWRVFFGIIPKTDDWTVIYNAIIKTRTAFTALSTGVIWVPDTEITDVLNKIPIQNENNFLQTKTVKESIQKILSVWLSKHPTANKAHAIRLLTFIVYSIYPSCILTNTDGDKSTTCPETVNDFFFFVNDEDYFEADAFAIFSAIMEQFDFSSNMKSLAEDNSVLDFNETLESFSKDKIKNYIKCSSIHNKISFIYPYYASGEVIEVFRAMKFDPFCFTKDWYCNLFTTTFPIEHIGYIWDIVFMADDKQEMLCMCIGGIMNILKKQIQSAGSLKEIEEIFRSFPQESIRLKDIVKKAFKVKEKIADD